MPPQLRNFTALAPLARVVHPSQRSILRLVVRELVGLTAALILLLPTWILILIVVPIKLLAEWCVDRFMTTCLRQSYPGFRRLSSWDCVWLGQLDPSNPPIATVLITLEGGLTFEEIKALILDRMVLAKVNHDNLMYPRFMQKIVKVMGCDAWIYDGEFDADKHILLIPEEINSQNLLQTFIVDLAKTPLPSIHPLWTLHIAPSFGAEGETVLIFRFHQAMTDGISLVKILCRSVTDKTQEATVYHIKSRFGGLSLSINTFRSFLMASVFFITKILFAPEPDWRKQKSPFYDDTNPSDLKNAGLFAGRKTDLFWTEAVPLRVVDRISLVTRNSLNNILLTCLAGALRTCLTAQGIRRIPPVKATISVDLRKPLRSVTSSVKMGNQFVLLNVKLPTDTIGSVPRLWKIRQEEDHLKNTSHSTSIYWIVRILGHFLPPKTLNALVVRSAASCCNIVNLPGPDAQLCLDNKRINSLVFWPPSITSHMSVNVSFFTYADKLQMGISVDAELCEAKSLATEFAHEIKELSELLSNRRAPGEIKHRHTETHDPPQILRKRILEVQKALMEAQMLIGVSPVQKGMDAWNDQATKVETLKEELMQMLSMARRRKSVMEGVSMDFEEDDDMVSEVRSSIYSARRRTSSTSSCESVRVFAVTPTRLSEDARDSFVINLGHSRSRNIGSISESEPPSQSNSKQKTPLNAHVIYVTHDSESSDSNQPP